MSFPRTWVRSIVRSRHFLPGILILVVSGIAFWSYYGPRILQDDWRQIIAYRIFDQLGWFIWNNRRPMDRAVYHGVSLIFGLHLYGYYLINYLLVLAVGGMVYALVDRFFSELRPLPLLIALLAIVYPADFTVTWMTMLNNRLAWLLALLGIWALLEFHARQDVYLLVMASLLFAFPLMIHEGALGQAGTAWGLVTIAACFKYPIRKLSLYLLPGLGIVAFAAFRLVLQPFLGVSDFNLQAVSNASPRVVLERYLEIKIYALAWIEPLQAAWQAATGHALGKWFLLGGLALLLGLSLLLGYLGLRALREPGTSFPEENRRSFTRSLLVLLGFSILFTVTGYVPSILIFAPNLDSIISTRVNIYSIPFVTGIIGALLGWISMALAASPREWRVLVSAGMIPLVVIGTASQVYFQRNRQLAWKAQKSIWQQMFRLAPDFVDGTGVLIVMDGYTDMQKSESPPLYSEWEVDLGLQSLYESPSLHGRILFDSAHYYSEANLVDAGVYDGWENDFSLVPYDKMVVFHYSEATGRLSLVEDIETLFPQINPAAEYAPAARIVEASDRDWSYRFLVEGR
jgi:hypothetical protein